MAATTTADFRNGMVIRYNGELYTVTEFHHVSPGNWRAFVRVRLKNLKTGRVLEQRFRAGEEIEEVRVEHQNWQFLYVDGDDYIFMNTETFDQQPVPMVILQTMSPSPQRSKPVPLSTSRSSSIQVTKFVLIRAAGSM